MNHIQDIYLNLIAINDYSNFNGESISEDLQSLDGIVKGFIPANSKGSLRSLYRLIQGKLEVDTLFIFVSSFDAHIIKRYAQQWNVSEVTVISNRELEGSIQIPGIEVGDNIVLRLWWDLKIRS